MSLTRYLPLPSDRMGILWNLLSIEESIVVEYGPAGTTHFSMSLFGELGVDNENRLFTTHMSEDDVVMGDVSRLEKALVEIDEAYHPRVLFVVASSIASVIGTDIKGVCNYMADRVKARLVAFDQGGFRGDYSMGCQAVWKLLAEEFPGPCAKKDAAVCNLLGVSAGSYRMRSDVWELKELLKEAFGMTVKTSFCCDTSVSAMEQAGCASVNLVLRDEALPCAEILKERCGTPYYAGMPYGYKGTLDWLEGIGEITGRKPDQKVTDRLRKKAADAAMYKMYARMLKKDTPAAALAGEYHTVQGLSRFLEDMGIPAEHKICLHSLKPVRNPGPGIFHPASEKERMEIFGNLHKTLVLGDDVTIKMCPLDNLCCRVSTPVINGVQAANHLPVAGERGADALIELAEHYFQILQ